MRFTIDPDIRKASTLPSEFYRSEAVLEWAREHVFARSWQLVADTDAVKRPRQVYPLEFVPGCVDEPLLLIRDEQDQIHCVSNVCTHRGKLVVEEAGQLTTLRCSYHGRRFALDGRFESMPEFEGTEDFPSEADNLKPVRFETWGKFMFAAIDPLISFEELIEDVRRRVGWLPIGEATLDAGRSRDYLVQANWALYCDNYLEGFHIPYVHHALNQQLDYGQYRTETYRYSNVQIGVSKGGEFTFDQPPDAEDAGKEIGGYYYFLFPNTMMNFYPWGVSVNIVKPLGVDRTRVSFLTYVWDPSRLDKGAGAALDRVEREDEVVVESVQKGIRSRLYDRGRYSPSSEQCVHHFHRLLSREYARSGP